MVGDSHRCLAAEFPGDLVEPDAAALCVSGTPAGTRRRDARAIAADDNADRRLQVGSRHAGAVRRPRQVSSRTSRRCGQKLAAMNVVSRPHAKTHKCPTIAKLQLAGGSIGICTAKISEAEVFVGRRHRADPDDDVERDGEQDPPRDGRSARRTRSSSRRSTIRRTRATSTTRRRRPASSPTS